MPGRVEHPEQQLLMISSHLPQVDGPAERQRAWELLTLASRTHRVHLASLLDGPIQLEQWRMLARRTEKLAIIPRGMGQGKRRMRREIGPWLAQHRFDAVLCGTTALWSILDQVNARWRVCDLRFTTHRRWRDSLLPLDVIRLTDTASLDQLSKQLALPGTVPIRPVITIAQTEPLPLPRAA